MIDTHCHLTHKDFDKDRNEVIERAQRNGVTSLITIANTIEDAYQAAQLSELYSGFVYFTAGIHPHHAHMWTVESENAIRNLLTKMGALGVGEIGLDYHYDFSPREIQRTVFEAQLSIARNLNLPAIIHSREALTDVWEIVERVRPQKLVIHCCTESYDLVEPFINAGYYLSFTGIATFEKSTTIREAICRCPMDRIMIETDAPYLAPRSQRGKRNEPAFLRETLATIASEKGIAIEEAEKMLDINSQSFFGLIPSHA